MLQTAGCLGGSWGRQRDVHLADKERNIDTSKEEYIGRYVVKEDRRSGCRNAAAIIMCSPAGQIALGAPRPKTKSNGELTLCHNLNVVDAAAPASTGRRSLCHNLNVVDAAAPASTGRRLLRPCKGKLALRKPAMLQTAGCLGGSWGRQRDVHRKRRKLHLPQRPATSLPKLNKLIAASST